jgi:hypothetical protein
VQLFRDYLAAESDNPLLLGISALHYVGSKVGCALGRFSLDYYIVILPYAWKAVHSVGVLRIGIV